MEKRLADDNFNKFSQIFNTKLNLLQDDSKGSVRLRGKPDTGTPWAGGVGVWHCLCGGWRDLTAGSAPLTLAGSKGMRPTAS